MSESDSAITDDTDTDDTDTDGADVPAPKRPRMSSPRFLITIAFAIAFLLIFAASLRRVRQRSHDQAQEHERALASQPR